MARLRQRGHRRLSRRTALLDCLAPSRMGSRRARRKPSSELIAATPSRLTRHAHSGGSWLAVASTVNDPLAGIPPAWARAAAVSRCSEHRSRYSPPCPVCRFPGTVAAGLRDERDVGARVGGLADLHSHSMPRVKVSGLPVV